VFINVLAKEDELPREVAVDFVKLLHPFAPFITEELWERMGYKPSILFEKWPSYDPSLLVEDQITVVLQVNGKVRDNIQVSRGISQKELEALAQQSPKVQSWIAGKEIVKIIVVPEKLVNIVVK
jgi:leucyl-tRNA synthetase